VLERNESYWGTKPAWKTVIFRPITSAGPRVAALLSGDVDMIESVPIQDLPRVKSNAGFKVVQGLSNRVIYLHFDYIDDTPPGVEAGGKKPVPATRKCAPRFPRRSTATRLSRASWVVSRCRRASCCRT
jgi:peptide/nickel transport system substrate-binding protein